MSFPSRTPPRVLQQQPRRASDPQQQMAGSSDFQARTAKPRLQWGEFNAGQQSREQQTGFGAR